MPHRDIPFTLVGIDHVVLYVDDMPKALAFYRDVLGCPPGYSYPALGMEQVWAGAALIVFAIATQPSGYSFADIPRAFVRVVADIVN